MHDLIAYPGAEAKDRQKHGSLRHLVHDIEEAAGEAQPVKQAKEKGRSKPAVPARRFRPKDILRSHDFGSQANGTRCRELHQQLLERLSVDLPLEIVLKCYGETY
jgi:hypothetical protein